MVMTDPIADMLTRIRNANTVNHPEVVMPASKIKRAIAQILKDEGFVSGFSYAEDDKQGSLKIVLKYGVGKARIISGLKRISKPGLRVYTKHDELPRVFGGMGIAIVSTSQGLMTDRDARKGRLGGEVLAYVW